MESRPGFSWVIISDIGFSIFTSIGFSICPHAITSSRSIFLGEFTIFPFKYIRFLPPFTRKGGNFFLQNHRRLTLSCTTLHKASSPIFVKCRIHDHHRRMAMMPNLNRIQMKAAIQEKTKFHSTSNIVSIRYTSIKLIANFKKNQYSQYADDTYTTCIKIKKQEKSNELFRTFCSDFGAVQKTWIESLQDAVPVF